MNIFEQIETTLPNMDGWCSVEKGKVLAMIVLAMKPSLCVEIGVWGGRSALPVALALKQNNSGKLVAIDAWSPKASVEGYDEKNADWWREQNHEIIYQKFLDLIHKNNVANFVSVARMKSDDYDLSKEIQYLHIDGQHTIQALTDVERYAVKVSKHGICVMDDILWDGGGVIKAVEKLKEFGFQELFKLGTGAVFQKYV